MRTLFIRLGSLGDVVLTTPAVEAMKKAYPEGEIDYLVKKEYADLLSDNPHIREVIPFDNRGTHKGAGGLFKMVASLKERNYSHVIDLHSNLRSRLISTLMGHAKTVRYKKQAFKRRLLLKGLKFKTKHVVDTYLDALGGIGIHGERPLPKIYLTSGEIESAGRFLKEKGIGKGDKLIGLNPGAKWPTKQWPGEKYIELGQKLAATKGCRLILFGGKEESNSARWIAKEIGPAALSVAGETNLKESAALMAGCDLFISNDSGPMHMAAAVGVPVVAIFGPTVQAFGFSPLGQSVVVEADISCRPCSLHGSRNCPKGHFECMNTIDIERVIEEINKFSAKISSGPTSKNHYNKMNSSPER